VVDIDPGHRWNIFRRQPGPTLGTLPYGIAVLGSLPLAIVFVIAFLAVASSR
jgi:hypothetical protein